MSKSLHHLMTKLEGITPRFRDELGKAAETVLAVDRFLADLGLGVVAAVPYEEDPFCIVESFTKYEDTPICRTINCLAYGRVEGTYRIHVLTITTQEDKVVRPSSRWRLTGENRCPWGSCSQEMQLRSFAKLPELLDQIVEKAEGLSQAASHALLLLGRPVK